jgi:AbrB family looped-hinge helix DNA binding protein
MTNCHKSCSKKEFYGTTTVGERGQVVIPSQARKDFSLEKGEQLLVFGAGENMITLVKVKGVKELATKLSKKLDSINLILKKITK